jgi:hypothetical protein
MDSHFLLPSGTLHRSPQSLIAERMTTVSQPLATLVWGVATLAKAAGKGTASSVSAEAVSFVLVLFTSVDGCAVLRGGRLPPLPYSSFP